MNEQDNVYLLYEGDEWLSSDSLVLMSVITDENKKEALCEQLIKQRINKNLDTSEYDGDWSRAEMKADLTKRILKELLSNGQTQNYEINYMLTAVTPNKIEEI